MRMCYALTVGWYGNGNYGEPGSVTGRSTKEDMIRLKNRVFSGLVDTATGDQELADILLGESPFSEEADDHHSAAWAACLWIVRRRRTP